MNDGNYCPVENTIQMLSKKYIMSILLCLYEGKSHFNEFLDSNPKLTNKSLSRCLKYMQDNDLIKREVSDSENLNTEYFLTKKSKKLKGIILEIANYTIENDSEISESQKEKLNDAIRKHGNF